MEYFIIFVVVDVIIYALFFSPGSNTSKEVPSGIGDVLLFLLILAVLCKIGYSWAIGR